MPGWSALRTRRVRRSTDAVQQFLALLRLGDVLHPLGHRAVGDDLRALEELIAPDVVRVFVRVDDALRHGGPHLAEHLDHLPRMGQVRLRVDHHAPAQVDEAGVGVTHAVLLDQDRKAVVADLFHFHVVSLFEVKGTPSAITGSPGFTRRRWLLHMIMVCYVL